MPQRKDRVILDTNIFISFLLTNDFSKFDYLLNESKIELIYSKELLEELVEVTQRKKFKKYFDNEDVEQFLYELGLRAEMIDVTSEIEICRDPKDNFLLSLAKDSQADYLITGDKDLLVLKKMVKTKIITLTEYLEKKIN